MRRPDLIIVVADEWRGDAVGHVGTPAVRTPHLDELVERDAVSFTRAFCQNPVCVPSRCSMMTGWYPHVRGHRTQHHKLSVDEPNLLRRLRDFGYLVWWGGKNDLLTDEAIEVSVDIRHRSSAPGSGRLERQWSRLWEGPQAEGYYSFYAGRRPADEDDDLDRRDIAAAIDLLRRHPADQPVCVLLTLRSPHCPYAVPDPYYGSTDRGLLPAPLPRPEPADHKPRAIYELIRRQGLTSWAAEQWRELRGTYFDMCTRTDAMIGDLIAAARGGGRYDDTAIIVTADHGDFAGDFGLPEKAQNVFDDSLTRVPLVIKPPRAIGRRLGVADDLVELVDLTATVEDLAGMARGYDHFGRSLLPVLTGDSYDPRSDVLCEGGRLEDEPQAAELASRQDPEGLYYPRMSLQREDFVAHGKATMLRTTTHKYVFRLYEDDELYDLERDPGERRNLIHEPDLSATATRLRERLLARMVETADIVPRRIDPR